MTPILLIVKDTYSKTALIEKFHINFSSNHPDQLIIQPDKKIGIDIIRQIKTYVSTRPLNKPTKTVILLNAQSLTLPAQNAFLKTLEENPPYSKIILSCHNQHSLLPTITSRCHIIHINDPNTIIDSPSDDNLLVEILNADIPERFMLAEKHAVNRKVATDTLKSLLQISRQNLHQNPTAKMSQNLKNIHLALQKIAANTNPKLTLEYTFTNLIK